MAEIWFICPEKCLHLTPSGLLLQRCVVPQNRLFKLLTEVDPNPEPTRLV
jgi:hypothetical protein